MTLNLITLATVKTQLGIFETDYDVQITDMIPIVSADVRRILNCKYNDVSQAFYASGSTKITLSSAEIPMGQVIEGENIPDDCYITAEDVDSDEYTLSALPVGSGDYITFGVNISQWPTISKMIFYRINNMSILNVGQENVMSKSIGGASVSYGNSQINKRWNYPQLLIDDLGVPYSEVG